jgi:hypothetical protein
MKFEPNVNMIHLILAKVISSHVHEDLLDFWYLFTLISLIQVFKVMTFGHVRNDHKQS